MAVPPMPIPKTPTARPRFAGGNHGGDERDADGERGAADPQEEPADQQRGQRRLPGQPQVQHRHDRRQRHQREHHPAAEPVGQRADRDPAQRTDHHRHRNQRAPAGTGSDAASPSASAPTGSGVPTPRSSPQSRSWPRPASARGVPYPAHSPVRSSSSLPTDRRIGRPRCLLAGDRTRAPAISLAARRMAPKGPWAPLTGTADLPAPAGPPRG